MWQLLERKISFLNFLFVYFIYFFVIYISIFFFLLTFFVIRILLSAFSHPHPPSAGIRSSFYRHPLNLNCHVKFDVTNNNKLIDSYLRCAYNHVLLDKIFTALSNSLFSTSKFEDLFRACALSLPVIFLPGNDVYKSDLTISDFGFVNKRSGYKSICRDPYSQSSSRPRRLQSRTDD